MNEAEAKFIKGLRLYSLISAWAAIVLGLIVIVGWAFDITILKSILPSFVSMKANTAFAFVLSGVSLVLLQKKYLGKINKITIQLTAFIVLLIGVLTIVEYLFHQNFGIDQILFKDDEGAILTTSPGRMSANTAICFIFIGLSLLLYKVRIRNNILPTQILALFTFTISLIGLFGYVYSHWKVLQVMDSTMMAMHTVILFFILSLGILFSQPLEGLIKKISIESSGGMVIRYIIPFVIFFPLFIELITTLGFNLGLYNAEMEHVFHSIFVVLILGILFWFAISKYDSAEKKLLLSETRFRTVFENSPLGKSMTGIDGSLHVNKSFYTILGYSENEFKKKKWQEITHPDDIKESEAIIQSLIEDQLSQAHYEKRYIHKNGDIVWTDVNTTLQRDINGQPLYFITTISDITEAKKAESNLLLEKERIRTILDLVGDPIFVKGNDHRITMANRAFYDIFGLDEDSVIGYTLVEAVPENEREQFLEVDRKVLDTGITDTREEELTVGDSTRTIITRKTRFIDESGEKILVGSIHDITNVKQFENRILRQVEYANELIDSVPGLFYQISPEGKFTKWNKNFEIVSGYTSEEMGKISPLDLFEGNDKFQVEANIKNVFTEGNASIEANLISKTGIKKPYYFTGKLINIDDNPLLVGMGMDISDQKDAELELKVSEEKYRALVENSVDSIFMIDREFRVVFMNEQAARQFKSTKEQVIGKKVDDLFPKQYAEKQITSLKKVFTDKQIIQAEEVTKFPGGEVWLETKLIPVFDESKNVKFVYGISADITERKQAEEMMQETSNRLIEVQSVAHLGSWEWDAVNDEIKGSDEFYRLFDLADDKQSLFRFQQFIDRIHPDDVERVNSDVADSLKQKKLYDTEYRVKLNNGWRDIGAKGQVFTDTKGKIVRMIGTCMDITERKRAEDELSLSKNRYRNLINNSPVSLWEEDWTEVIAMVEKIKLDGVTDFNSFFNQNLEIVNEALSKIKILDVNSETLKMFKADNKQQMLESLSLVFATDDTLPGFIGELVALANGRSVYETEMSLCTVKGEILNTFLRMNFPTPDTVVGQVLVSIMDITEVKKAEEQLKSTMKNLERSNHELEQFAYVASHDLQEPLRMVSSFTQLLEKRYANQLDADAKEFIGFAVDGANRMQKLINDLLDYSRITTRGEEFSKLDVTDVLAKTIANLHEKIRETGAIVTNEDLPFIKGDESQLIRLFQNLIDNAIKFRGESSPHIHISFQSQPDEWQISVKDNGVGIKPEYTERIFQIFQRLSSDKEIPGTGIGLAVCKRIVERHSGKIWVESEEGKGSIFYFTIKK